LLTVSIFQIDFDGFSSIRTARSHQARSAQFNLFSLPNIARADVVPRLAATDEFIKSPAAFGTSRAGPHCQRTASRGLKSRSGGLLCSSTAIDALSLDRPRRGGPRSYSPSPHIVNTLFTVFKIFYQNPSHPEFDAEFDAELPEIPHYELNRSEELVLLTGRPCNLLMPRSSV
jgi:hypothetical protein